MSFDPYKGEKVPDVVLGEEIVEGSPPRSVGCFRWVGSICGKVQCIYGVHHFLVI